MRRRKKRFVSHGGAPDRAMPPGRLKPNPIEVIEL
jgi:hypothetical protein